MSCKAQIMTSGRFCLLENKLMAADRQQKLATVIRHSRRSASIGSWNCCKTARLISNLLSVQSYRFSRLENVFSKNDIICQAMMPHRIAISGNTVSVIRTLSWRWHGTDAIIQRLETCQLHNWSFAIVFTPCWIVRCCLFLSLQKGSWKVSLTNAAS